ncbi:hypothetical protein NIES22_61380 [Calothrix brevissima NIES-22]|nr:hypothetical protein NIES22_61380 [Calothrix brevissima NIES-22]
MGSSFTNQLFNLLFSPLGLLGIVLGWVIFNKAKRSRRLAWFLFSLFCYTASLGKYEDQWITAPPLVVPLEQLRDMGRPLTIVLLCLLLILGIESADQGRRTFIPKPIKYLIVVQFAFFYKILLFGEINFALLGLITFVALVLMLKLGPSRWLQNEQNFHLGVWSIAMAGVIFGFAGVYQGVFNLQAMTFLHGRFTGTTGNPLHATALLAATIPSLMFLIEMRQKWDWVKVFWIANLFILLYFLFLTGSRTGLIMAVPTILLFYRQRLGTLLRLGFFVGIVLAFMLYLQGPDVVMSNTVASRYSSTQNTREGVWSSMSSKFIKYPVFGAPLEGGRLGFGESTWLATGSTTGLIGFIPLVMMGIECVKMMFKLHQLSSKNSSYIPHCSTVIGGLTSLLSGSFTEAILLGNLTFPVISLIMYLSLGKYLLLQDERQSRSYFMENNATFRFFRNS